MQKHAPARRVLHVTLTVIGLAVLAVIFYVSVILANPQEDENPVRTDAPLRASAPARTLTDVSEMDSFLAEFPGPALLAAPGSALTLTAGRIADRPVRGGYARVLTLLYRTPDGGELAVNSIWPAGASDAADTAGWHLAGAGPSVAGMESFRAENGQRLRLQCQGTEALYTVETDLRGNGDLAALLRPLMTAPAP